MLKSRCLLIAFFGLLVVSCSSEDLPPAQPIGNIKQVKKVDKAGFDPIKHGFACDSLIVQPVKKGKIIEELTIYLGNVAVDTIDVKDLKIEGLDKEEVTIIDFNFDGFCDFVVRDIVSANHGGMNYYYYLYDNESLGYQMVTTLPKFISSFKMDIKNQRVKIYCPYEDCFAYYKYQDDGTFKLVQGKYEAVP